MCARSLKIFSTDNYVRGNSASEIAKDNKERGMNQSSAIERKFHDAERWRLEGGGCNESGER